MRASNRRHRKPFIVTSVYCCCAILATTFSPREHVVAVTPASRSGRSEASWSSKSNNRNNRSPQGKLRAAWAGSSRADAVFPLLHLHFCLDCPDAAAEGSVVRALAPHHGIREFKVSGEDLVYAVPNTGNKDTLLNGDDMAACVVMFERGEVPMVEKVLKAQAAGAVGVIVVDNGGCDDGLVDCGRLGGARDGGFAKRDGVHAWSGVKIPAVMVSAADGERFRGMMLLQKILVEGLGEQLVER
ncbi:unnamed protein product [Ectocarpus sp. 6 AP-2014]